MVSLPPTWTPDDVAAYFRVSIVTVRRWQRRGLIRPVANTGRGGTLRFNPEQVVEAMKGKEAA